MLEFLVNDLSIHKQFHEFKSFREAIARLMNMREVARKFGREVYCHQALLAVETMPGVPIQKALGRFSESERRSVMSWLTRSGPFWDDLRQYSTDDYLESQGEIVTDSAVGEAAYRTLHSVKCALLSITPSDWDYTPIHVIWRRKAEALDDRSANLENWRDSGPLELMLQYEPPSISSWNDLRNVGEYRFSGLTFAHDCFDPLEGVPFAKSAAERVLVILNILDRLTRAFDEDGRRTKEGHRIYQEHFTGDMGLFSDSSDSEKQNFRNELTFPHPSESGSSLFCGWHGKERHLTLRVHFSWPVRANEPVYVVYVGPKLTKQ